MVRDMLSAAACALAIISLGTGCTQRPMPAKTLVLPSGEQIVLVDTHGDAFADISGRNRHIFYIGYETSHGMDETTSLRTEARRTFALYLPQLIGLDYDTCVVTPMKRATGGDLEGRPYYFTRQPDGRWLLQP